MTRIKPNTPKTRSQKRKELGEDEHPYKSDSTSRKDWENREIDERHENLEDEGDNA